jgi:hypothetical protein
MEDEFETPIVITSDNNVYRRQYVNRWRYPDSIRQNLDYYGGARKMFLVEPEVFVVIDDVLSGNK